MVDLDTVGSTSDEHLPFRIRPHHRAFRYNDLVALVDTLREIVAPRRRVEPLPPSTPRADPRVDLLTFGFEGLLPLN